MKPNRADTPSDGIRSRSAWVGFLLLLANVALLAAAAEATTNLVVWDTGSKLTRAGDPDHRADWRAVPSDLLVFEAEPLKAASDPGYYGREYAFRGDVVVENASLAAVFWSARGRMILYSKTPAASAGAEKHGLGRKILEVAPSGKGPEQIRRCEIVRQAGDEFVVDAFFAGPDDTDLPARFTFGKNEIVEVKASAKMPAFRLSAPIEYGVVPGFVGDDLIFPATDSGSALFLPVESIFVGLLNGESDALVMTWPEGKQQLKLNLANPSSVKRAVESLDFDHAGKSFYLAALNAPGLWHREELKPTYLEKDVALNWTRPFPAKWKTQLNESGVRTTFAFREAKGTVWRGVPGSYNYPVWFDGEKAFYHLGKKVPPKGESIVYFLEGQNTPATFSTPVDILKATLGRAACEALLDVEGQKLRTHHRRSGDGVHRSCTCGYTEAIQAIFERGEEMDLKETVKEWVADMNYFVERHVERIEEYQRFAADLGRFLQSKSAAVPEMKAFLEPLEEIVQKIPQEYRVQKENMKSAGHAAELTRQTMALTASKNTNNLAAYKELLKAWRAMGGAQDYVVAYCHTATRKLFQEAGYGCVNDAKALAVAQEIRARCRQVLRNPDGYEIWANY